MSAIVYALEGYLQNFPDTVREKKSEFKDGEVYIAFFGNENAYSAFMVAVIGLMQISKSYPEYVTVKYSEK